jgi:hypothetical protein
LNFNFAACTESVVYDTHQQRNPDCRPSRMWTTSPLLYCVNEVVCYVNYTYMIWYTRHVHAHKHATCTGLYTHTHTYTHTYVYIHHTYTYIHTCIHACIHTYVRTYIHTSSDKDRDYNYMYLLLVYFATL